MKVFGFAIQALPRNISNGEPDISVNSVGGLMFPKYTTNRMIDVTTPRMRLIKTVGFDGA
jgi:hypothetical protein